MKKLIYIVFLLSNITTHSQEIVPKEHEKQYLLNGNYTNKYFKDMNGHLDKFLGTWKWQDNPINPTKNLEITFYKLENKDAGSYREDLLVSKYKYIENDVEIYNNESGMSETSDIFGGVFSFPTNLNKLRLYYSEPDIETKGFRYSFYIEYLPSSTIGVMPNLKWDLEVVLEVAPNATLPKIPTHIVLTKQP